jgi:preprotein translocase subunit SecA
VLAGENLREKILDLLDEYSGLLVDTFCPPDEKSSDWNTAGMPDAAAEVFGFRPAVPENADREGMMEAIYYAAEARYGERERSLGPDTMRKLEHFIYLQSIDAHWMDHLLAMDHLREGIGLRGYGQKDPKLEYKKEGYSLFMGMLDRIREDVLRKLFRVELRSEGEEEKKAEVEQFRPKQRRTAEGAQAGGRETRSEPVRKGPKVGRNDPCPCGSGLKYKKCCLLKEQAGP